MEGKESIEGVDIIPVEASGRRAGAPSNSLPESITDAYEKK